MIWRISSLPVIGHVDVARAVHRHTLGKSESCRAAGAIAGTCLPSGAGQGGDHARRADLADLRHCRDRPRRRCPRCPPPRPSGQSNLAALPVPSLEPVCPAEPARVVTTPDGVILRISSLRVIGHVDVARAVHRHTVGIIKSCRAAGAIAGTCLPSGAGQGGDYAGRGDLADLIIAVHRPRRRCPRCPPPHRRADQILPRCRCHRWNLSAQRSQPGW